MKTIRRWIIPKWGECSLAKIKPIEVELWLCELSLARSTCAKIKNIMSVLFNHARRYELFDENPLFLFAKVPNVAGSRTSSTSIKSGVL
jgi:hypothetical protein